MNRLKTGGVVDCNQPIRFTFNGKQYIGYQGDTVASALLANGIKLIGRSWKYHRPRGVIGDGAEEPNAIFQVEQGAYTIPNVRGTQAEIYEGMVLKSTNVWPSVKFDLLSVNRFFARVLPAGFYYKTFMWPKSLWRTYEHFIRKASGLGASPVDSDPDSYEKTNAHCDILVIGAGPTGIMAALTAAKAGVRVMLLDEQADFGGRLLSQDVCVDGVESRDWVANKIDELRSFKDVQLIKRATAFGYHDANFVTVNERLTDHLSIQDRTSAREKVWRVRAKQIVLATGAHERPIVFGNNDRPGIMLASAAATYVNRYRLRAWRKAVVFTNNDSAYEAALSLVKGGVNIAAVVDCRRNPLGTWVDQIKTHGIPVLTGSVISGAYGGRMVTAVDVQTLDGDGCTAIGQIKKIACDLVAVSGGWNPAVHLFAQSGGKARWCEQRQCFVPHIAVQDQISAGAANGVFELADCLYGGVSAAQQVLSKLGRFELDVNLPKVVTPVSSPLQALWHVSINSEKPWRGAKQIVDYQNDVSVSDIYLAAREGFESVEHVKRYTALGFGTDQGKTGNIVGMAILARALKQDIPSTGTTTFRPNYTPVSFGAIAGPEVGGTLFDPVRKTALHEWHEEAGAMFENVGQWHRPWYYPKKGESMREAVNRECLAVRKRVGIMDASTLGKIELSGKDTSEFLNRVYTNAWKKLGVNCCRYGLMLGEDGMVMDDGVTVRLDEHRYLMYTTTGGAASVLQWLELWHQTEWPELEVYMTSVTDHWVTAAVVGPNSRQVVAAVVDGIKFSAEDFPFMMSREGTVGDVAVRVNRISFSGELAYEVNINANNGRDLWERLMAAGEEYEITPYGTESLHVLRAEKGYVIVGQDTDGSVTPTDLGMTWALSKTKDYLGRRSLERSDSARTDRKQFVGLLTEDPNWVLPEGGQIVNDQSSETPTPMVGHVTSSYWSPILERSIALALVKNGFQRMGETIYIALGTGEFIPAKIGSTVFYDANGEQQKH